MNDEEIEQFKQKLISLRLELQEMEQAHKQASAVVELDQTRVGRLSRMDAMQVQEMALQAVRRRQHQMLEIEGALRRMESGEYGYCFVCGEEIVAARLDANPACTRCMTCAE